MPQSKNHPFLFVAAWLACSFVACPNHAVEVDSFAERRNDMPADDRMRLQVVSQNGETLVPTSSPDTTAQLAVGRDEQSRTWLIVSNPHPWPIVAELVTRPRANVTMLASTSDRPLLSSKRNEQNTTRQLVLEASTRGTWQVTDGPIEISQWSYRIEPRTMTELETKLVRLGQALSQLTSFQSIDGLLEHGDFEIETEVDKLPSNWNTSMVPSSHWELSRDTARSGVGSIVFENLRSDTRGWLQSPSVPVPNDGRIAAAVWLKLDSIKSIPTVTASTMLIEPNEERREWKHTYSPSELNRKSDGWQRIEFPGLTPNSLKSLGGRSLARFTLDIEGACELRFDDFTAGRVILDEDERRELRTNLYVARRELSQNRPQSAWDLSKSEVFRFVVESAPTTSPASEQASSMLPEARTAEGLLRNSRPETRKPIFDGSRRKTR